MNALAVIAAIAMAVVLLWAGTEKLRAPGAVADVLQRIGLPMRATRPLALALALFEIVVALCLFFAPASSATLIGVLLLACAFAAAGMAAMTNGGEPVACHCLGPLGSAHLGWAQVLALPVWVAGGVLQLQQTNAPTIENSSALLCAVVLAMAAWRAITAQHETREGRGDRLAAEQMFVWLRR